MSSFSSTSFFSPRLETHNSPYFSLCQLILPPTTYLLTQQYIHILHIPNLSITSALDDVTPPDQPFLAYVDINYSIFTAKNLQNLPLHQLVRLITIQVKIKTVTMEFYAALSSYSSRLTKYTVISYL